MSETKWLLTRRESLALAAATACSFAASGPLFARTLIQGTENFDGDVLHGISIFGDLKYPEDYSAFGYVNPQAPKGGTLKYQPGHWSNNQNPQTFNTLNGYVTKGDAPPRLELLFDSLLVAAADEPDALYGAVARTIQKSSVENAYLFSLRPEAMFHDGSRLTSEDVVFSLNILKAEGHPNYRQGFRQFVEAKALSPYLVSLHLEDDSPKDLIFELAQAPIFSKAFYDGKDFTETTMELPVGSGPYQIGKISAGRYVEYERDETYWAKDLPFRVGQANFNKIRVEFFTERQAGFEAFKKGALNFREENTSKIWASEYNFPAIEDGRVQKHLLPSEKIPGFQALFYNMRRKKFADARVRQALTLCFDYEWVNENLFFGSYKRVASYVENSIYKAVGKPDVAELALLEPYRKQLPASIFEEPVMPPVSDGSGRDRQQLKRALELMVEAGWQQKDGKLTNDAGETFSMEILVNSSIFERVYGKFVEALKLIGVDASIRVVDPAQYQARTGTFDFDATGYRINLSATPFSSAELLFSSTAATNEGSRNWAGINDPVVDAMIDHINKARDRPTHLTAWKALDRVLRAGHYWLPGWYSANHRIAVWNDLAWPENKPDYAFPFEMTWWSKAQ